MGTYLVMVNNFKRSFQHRASFILTFLLPIVLCIIPGGINFGEASLRVGVLGLKENSSLVNEKQELYYLLENSEGIKFEDTKKRTANTDLITSKYQVILDYTGSSSLDSFEIKSNQNQAKIQQLQHTFYDAITSKQQIRLSNMKPQSLTLTERSLAILLTLFFIFSTVNASRIIRDRQNGIISRYQFARKKENGYVLGYFTYNFIITYIQVMVCIFALQLIQKQFSMSIIEEIGISLATTLISTVYSMLICLVSKSEVQANISASAFAAVFSLLGGTFVVIEAMPSLLQILSYASPVRWIIELVRLI